MNCTETKPSIRFSYDQKLFWQMSVHGYLVRNFADVLFISLYSMCSLWHSLNKFIREHVTPLA